LFALAISLVGLVNIAGVNGFSLALFTASVTTQEGFNATLLLEVNEESSSSSLSSSLHERVDGVTEGTDGLNGDCRKI